MDIEVYRKSSNYSAKKFNSNLRVALVLERKKIALSRQWRLD